MLWGSSSHAAESLTLFGEAKYKPGFTHFDYVNPGAPKGGTIKRAYNATFDNTNPYILKGIAAPGINEYLYQTLMTPSLDEPQSYYPLIASSVTVSPDRKTILFTLNPSARWHDGKPITAADVVFSLAALKQEGHPTYRILYKAFTATAEGAHRVRFTITGTPEREQPIYAAALPVLPQHYFCPLKPSPLAGEGGRGGVETNVPNPQSPNCVPFGKTTLAPPLGSGPYSIAAINPGRSIRFARVKDYWAANLPSQKGMYNFDTVTIDVYRDDTATTEGIKSHQFDVHEEFIARIWATSYDTPAVAAGQLIKTLVPHKIPRGMQGFLFNTRRGKFSDRRVREAVGLTLDFEWMNRVLFYDAYERGHSFFGNTEFEAKGLPDKEELALLNAYRKQLPAALFTTPSSVPKTDGTGHARDNVIRAQQLLEEAGWVLRDGVRVNAKTGEPLTIEFLMMQRTFERVIGIMRANLKKLGIQSSFRYVDASQYQRRIDQREFDIVSIWWNSGLFYPGNEQFTYWHSSQADTSGSLNLSGIKNPAVDALVDRIRTARTLEQLRPAARALDRVLLNEHYIIPHWTISGWRMLYWNQFGRPAITPLYNIGIDSWWQAAKSPSPAREEGQVGGHP